MDENLKKRETFIKFEMVSKIWKIQKTTAHKFTKIINGAIN